MKKIAMVVFSVGMAAGLLAGCKSADETTGGKQQVTVWIPPYAQSDAELTDQKFWDEKFDVFEQENNCTVKVEIIPWDGYKQKVITGLSSGEGPDVVYIDTPYDLVAAGAFEPLDEYFTEEETENYLYWDLGEINGAHYVSPMLVGNANILYCNMDILKKAGFDSVPETWEELQEYCFKIQETSPEVAPFLQGWGVSGKAPIMSGFLPYYWQTGEEFLNSEGKPDIDNEGGLETIKFLKSFQDNGIFDETIVAMDDLQTKFEDGKLAMYVGDTGSSKKLTEAGINWDFTPSLVGPSGKQATWIAADSLAVSSNSKNKELAVKALKYMESAPVMDSFHEEMYAMCPITKDASYNDDERFQNMYLEQAEIFHNWPAFANSDAFYDALVKNIQSMYMGDITPEDVIKDTMKQYEEVTQ